MMLNNKYDTPNKQYHLCCHYKLEHMYSFIPTGVNNGKVKKHSSY
jgi:hypothetical protein